MTFEEYRQLDATALASLIRQGKVLAHDVLELAITRAEAVAAINALVYPSYEQARHAAADVLTRSEGYFAGVPFLIKNLAIEAAGMPLTWGSASLRGNVSRQDSELMQRIRSAGLNVFARTNTAEFGLQALTEPVAYGPTRNPWSLTHSPGGSSGGSAAAVAAGVVPLASASDGGGSIRVPASCCGLFGLKPSRGRISLAPEGMLWGGAIVEGCVSRSVRDTAAYLDAVAGFVSGDPMPVPPPARPYTEEVQRDPGRLSIGFSTAHPLGLPVDPACVQAVSHTAQLLKKLGHTVEQVELPWKRDLLLQGFLPIVAAETAAKLAEVSRITGRSLVHLDIEIQTWLLGELGHTYSALDLVKAQQIWTRFARRMATFHRTYDLLLTPVTATPPIQIGELSPAPSEVLLLKTLQTLRLARLAPAFGLLNKLADQAFGWIPYTPAANISGQPAMSVPLHWTEDGLPLGVMFTAPMGAEDMLLRLAGQLEHTQPWFSRMPMI